MKRPNGKRTNEFQWIVEDLESHPSFVQRKMMGCELISFDGKQCLVFADKADPWNGLLLCTSQEHHESLRREFASLTQHPILKKWVYLPAAASDFEETANAIVRSVRRGDLRIGVESKPKKRPAAKRKAKTSSTEPKGKK